jgi:hypothetical protein
LQVALALEEHGAYQQLKQSPRLPAPQRGWLKRELPEPLPAAEHGERSGVFRCRVVRFEIPSDHFGHHSVLGSCRADHALSEGFTTKQGYFEKKVCNFLWAKLETQPSAL